ncbi:MAG: hypothetical protein V3T77_08780 [Planctomycetota bacterium]
MSLLRFERIECIPIIHGRLAFAMEARRRLLEHRYDAIAVELPPSLQEAMDDALQRLPTASVILYREQPEFLAPEAPCYYVPVQPADAIIEALRIARGERIPATFIDAEVEDFRAQPVQLPDPHALHTLGLEEYFRACLPALEMQIRTEQDRLREAHMVARLRELLIQHRGRILCLCGMAHWQPLRGVLLKGGGRLYPGTGIPPEQMTVFPAHPRQLSFLMGEMPFAAARFERHRSGFELEDHDPVRAIKELLIGARSLHRKRYPGSLERLQPQELRTVLEFARKMTVRKGLLIPDTYTLTVAAKGVVGNDFAVVLLELAHHYPWNGDLNESGDPPAEDSYPGELGSGFWGEPDDEPNDVQLHFSQKRASAIQDGVEVPLWCRTPGTAFQYGQLKLERPPDLRRRQEWLKGWNSLSQCSWPPEDLVIESFRDYVGKRALSLARVEMTRSEPFSTSFLDGIDIRETMRDVKERKIYVKEEPRVPGAVGALVLIFEEDDFGVRFPWRTTWMAEHQNESTLAFYATNYMENVIGPGIARAHYGGCMLVFPPIWLPDIWDDLRFERARTPSERLLLAAIYWGRDHFVVHVARRPPSAAVKKEAQRRDKHILHLPLSTFSSVTLERLRRVHVLNGREVRTHAHKFIR